MWWFLAAAWSRRGKGFSIAFAGTSRRSRFPCRRPRHSSDTRNWAPLPASSGPLPADGRRIWRRNRDVRDRLPWPSMKVPEHVAASFLLAQLGVQARYGTAGTLLVLAVGLLPDLDGLTILAGWRTYRTYHRI